MERHPSTPPTTDIGRPHTAERGYFVELLETFVWVTLVYLSVTLLTARFVVKGPSMQPSLETGQFLLVDRVGYWLRGPARSDVVVFHYPNNPTDDYIKRVIGLPGDTIELLDTRVYVNAVELDEPYINEPCLPQRCEDASWKLRAGEYFVMGDNRNISQDSRTFGPVPRRFIVGEAWLCYWPPSDWRNVRVPGVASRMASR